MKVINDVIIKITMCQTKNESIPVYHVHFQN